jgi:hypothetical protein
MIFFVIVGLEWIPEEQWQYVAWDYGAIRQEVFAKSDDHEDMSSALGGDQLRRALNDSDCGGGGAAGCAPLRFRRCRTMQPS